MGNEILLEGFHSGGDDKFKKTVFAYTDSLVYFGQKFGLSPQDAEEITSEAFFKLHERWQNFDHEIAIKSFLFKTVKNLAINHLKAEGNRRKRETDFYIFMGMTDDTFFGEVETGVLRNRLDRAVKYLSEGCREVFELHYYAGLTNEEIATQLGKSISNVTSQLSIARHKLKQLVQ